MRKLIEKYKMEREDLRPAKFNAYYDGELPAYCSENDGYFHRWAEDAFTDNSDTYHQRVVAIIEDVKGRVFKVPPEAVTLYPKKTLLQKVQELTDKALFKEE